MAQLVVTDGVDVYFILVAWHWESDHEALGNVDTIVLTKGFPEPSNVWAAEVRKLFTISLNMSFTSTIFAFLSA